MRNTFLLLFFTTFLNSFAQDLPVDSIILKKVFGKTDKGGMTYSCKYSGEENIYSYQDNVVYRIVFKCNINLNKSDLILAIIEAPYGTQHGHQFGYQDFYFFKMIGVNIELVDSIKSDRVYPIGDESVFEILNIGKNKKAIISTFQSSGNQHLENTKFIQLLELDNLTYLFTINSLYDNSAWKIPESENDDCEAERYTEVFEIVNNNSEWYDIKVHRTGYLFTKGCKDRFICIESDKVYKYFDGKYIESKK